MLGIEREAAVEAADLPGDLPFLSRQRQEGESLMALDIDRVKRGGVAALTWLVEGRKHSRTFGFKEGDLLIVLTADYGGPAGYMTICLGEESPFPDWNHALQIPEILAVFLAHQNSNVRAKDLPPLLRKFLDGQASRVNHPETWSRLVTFKPRGRMALLWDFPQVNTAEQMAV